MSIVTIKIVLVTSETQDLKIITDQSRYLFLYVV